MSRLAPPPQNSALLLPEGTLTSQAWGNWFNNLYQNLGAGNGVGAFFLSARIDSLSTAGSIWIPIPRNGTVTQVISCIQRATSGADETLTITSSTGTLGTITISNGSTAGTVDTLNPTTNNIVTTGGTIQIATAGTSSGAAPCLITLVVEYNA